jgi:Arc/MetJ-type ribon-helix-helix transcriptional regulator
MSFRKREGQFLNSFRDYRACWARDYMKDKRGKYTTVHIPTVLAELIDEVIENEEAAYSSRSEFIKDATRRLLEYYSYYPRKGQTRKREFRTSQKQGSM